MYSRRDSVIETRKVWHLHMQFKSPLSLIRGFVLCLIAVLLVSQVGRLSSRCLGCKKPSALLEARTVEFRRISGTRVKRKSRRRLWPWFSGVPLRREGNWLLSTSDHIDNDQGNVIMLRCRRRLPSMNLREQLIQQFRRRVRSVVANDLLKPVVAKGFAVAVLRFDHAIRVEQKAVTDSNGYIEEWVVGVRKDAEQQAVAFYAFQLAFAPEQQRWMSGRRIPCPAIFRVDPQIGRRHKLTPQLCAKDAIQSVQHLRRVVRAGYDRLHGHLDHRGNQRCRHAVPGYIRHQEAIPVSIDGNKLVEIPGNRRHRSIRRGHAKIFYCGTAARQNGRLNFSGNGQF